LFRRHSVTSDYLRFVKIRYLGLIALIDITEEKCHDNYCIPTKQRI